MGGVVHASLHPIFLNLRDFLLYIEEGLRDVANCFSMTLKVGVCLVEARKGLIELR